VVAAVGSAPRAPHQARAPRLRKPGWLGMVGLVGPGCIPKKFSLAGMRKIKGEQVRRYRGRGEMAMACTIRISTAPPVVELRT
jgi:hypothetical protein